MLNMWKVRELTEKVTNMVMNYTEVEAKVREATNDEAWGPTGPQMQELAQSTFYYEQFPEVMGMLWKRMLQDNRAAWRRTYKSLLLLNYLVRNGSERVVTSAREHIYDLRTLENFKYMDEHGKDQGLNIRVKAKDLIDFIQDDNRLREERKKAKKNKDKYVGVSSESMGFRGSGNSDWDNWGSSRRKEDSDFGSRFEDSPNISGDEVEEPVDPANEYHDEERSPKFNRPSTTLTLSSTSKAAPPQKKSSKPSKMVDLGAAATFGMDHSSSQQSTASATTTTNNNSNVNNKNNNNNSLLDDLFGSATSNGTASPAKAPNPSAAEDDFDPRAGEIGAETKVEFGNFAAGFAKEQPEPKPESDFADFSSFPQQEPAVAPSGGSSNASLLMGMMPSPAAPTSSTTPVVSAPGVPANSNIDLLQGLLGPSHPSTPVPSSTPVIPSPGASADFGGASLSGLTLTPTCAPLQPMSTMPTSRSESKFDIESEDPGTLDQKEEFTRHKTERSNTETESIQKKQRNMTDSLKDALKSSKANSSVIASALETVAGWLPGQVTPQQYAGTDQPSEDVKVFSKHFYGSVFTGLMENYLGNGVLRRSEKHKNLYYNFIEAGYLEENISILLKTLHDVDKTKSEILVTLLERIMKSSTCVQQFLLRHCSQARHSEKDSLDCEETIRLLTSLPDRVANKLQHKTPESFRPMIHCKVMAYHILQAVFFIADGLKHGVSGSVAPIGRLLGQLCLLSDTQAVLEPLTHWLILWGKDNPIIPRVSQKIYFHIPVKAKEKFLSSLMRIALGSKSLSLFLGSYDSTCPNTRYYIQEFLARGYFQKNTEALIEYLAATQSSHEALRTVFMKLLELWCDEHLISHSSFDHHVYISQGLVMCLKHLTQQDTEIFKHEVIEKLLPGIAYHLESPSHDMKLVGMVMAEEITKVAHKDGPALSFKYRDNDVTRGLKQTLAAKGSQEPEMTQAEDKNTTGGYSWESDFIAELQALDMLRGGEKQVGCKEQVLTSVQKADIQEQSTVLPSQEPSHETSQEGSKVEELDSDDDEFEPYDMSADTPEVKVREPSYPQEVLEYLAEGEVEKVTAALRVAEKIVRRELKLMNPELAEEMTKVVLHLEDKYSTEGFDENRLNTLSALVVAHPSQCALYLGCEFYERNYNLRQRLDIIHTLGRAAIELSGGEATARLSLPSPTSKGKSKNKPPIRNEMKNLAGCFFFPLISGLRNPQPYLDLLGADRFVLCELLRTLGLIINVTGQCEASLKMIGCLLEVTWSLRSHKDTEIRTACLEALNSGLESISDSVLLSLVCEEMADLREWLALSIQEDKNRKCQLLAVKLAIRLDKCFAQQIKFPQE
ncbi:telomere length regulation protein TEL2 homolog isoform X2 [Eriocheir sinensis]|uniref:telomere length regulation protein TEL2 homolog isoform X2 n=1 Tax=Eriocheir sinensis TaxID=95602 RepID=UPI0021C9A4A1|nr:telomere length regulation protein TEL2 homolog isoform X2 [Eriocheir sinensis]